MVFIPFIENAFKHSTNKKAENAITISILIQEKNIIFNCSNKMQPNERKEVEKGLGNELIKQRLELLYPQTHQLHTEEKEGNYIVQLSISRT